MSTGPVSTRDIGVEGLLAGWRSNESEESLRRWIEAKRAGRPLGLASLFPERAAPPATDEAQRTAARGGVRRAAGGDL